MQSDNKIEAGIAKAKFVRYIDELYKVSDAKNSFLYYDLIHPSKKLFSFDIYVLNLRLYCFSLEKDSSLAKSSPQLLLLLPNAEEKCLGTCQWKIGNPRSTHESE